MTSPSNPIVFYDIASAPPVTTFAPNPWKTRLALNFKKVHYKTSWTDLTEVATVRKSLGALPCRKHWVDNTDFYTLPVITDPSTGAIVGDSFDIAIYLDKIYPNNPTLIPPGTLGLLKVLNSYVDRIFTSHVALTMRHFPFNPETAHLSKKEFCRRAGMDNFEDMLKIAEGENRQKLLASFQKALSEEPFELHGLSRAFLKQDEGPFLNGKEPMYGDLILGAWLQMYRKCLPKEEWEMLRSWNDGLWGRLSDALEEYKLVDGGRDG
ncbi:hypothetical protein H072_11070 [Dactylellina haptotyla CBS 200.50]|uniref:Uncharacterized protein n=1 Tax=Dactylellina haptotyla (strain CBS 200.50) TaxID=1284197 RepID=S8B8Z1_DACHA|nr:hypothetical protein H072_11070 [Dactylellina haptotyla CBS 200.50]